MRTAHGSTLPRSVFFSWKELQVVDSAFPNMTRRRRCRESEPAVVLSVNTELNELPSSKIVVTLQLCNCVRERVAVFRRSVGSLAVSLKNCTEEDK